MKKIEGGVTAAKGFMASSAAAGIKYKDRDDMALVYSEKAAVFAGTFTKNVVKAAPVQWDMERLRDGKPVHAVVLNSGIANACTGREGAALNLVMAQEIATQFDILPKEVLTASTGVIGMQMQKEPLVNGARLLKETMGDTKADGTRAAKAIMTTDTVSKESAICFEVQGKTVTVGGMSKGSGMIHPDMATMLSVTTTDAGIGCQDLQELVREVVSDTFNMISVDRDTSTNDTFLVLANGESGVTITKGSSAYEDFKAALFSVAEDLAKQMAADGEGCTKLLEARVVHCRDKEKAKILSRAVVSSNLVKTAVYGSDANWGRFLCALGYAGVDFNPEAIDLCFVAEDKSLMVMKNGMGTAYSEEEATELLSGDTVTVVCDMKEGEAEATAWGCDLTYEYIKINADYRS